MRGLKNHTMKRQSLANGGMVRGPGTGTSDDVEDVVPKGSYILPADTTKAIGPQTVAMLDSMQRASGGAPAGLRGAEMPVNLSNGEYEVSPEQVHAVGLKALDQVKNATHTPVPEKDGGEMRMFFANGGAVDDEAERLRRQTAMYVQGAQAAAAARPLPAPVAPPVKAPGVLQTDPQARADRDAIAGVADSVADSFGNAGRAVADIAALPVRAVAGAVDSTAVRGLRAAGVNAPYISPSLVPAGVDPSSMTPFTDQKRMQQAAPAPAASPAQPAVPAAAGVVAPAPALAMSTAITTPPGAQAGSPAVPATTVAPSAGATTVPGVFRVGNSFSDSQSGAEAGAVPRGLPSAQNMAAADVLAARSGAESAARVAAPASRGMPGITAPIARSSANDWQARNDLRNLEVSAKSITNTPEFSRGATRNWRGQLVNGQADQDGSVAAYTNALKNDLSIRAGQPAADVAAMRENAALQREGIQQQGGIDRENIQQAGANTRSARGLQVDKERLGIDRSRAASENEARGVTTQGAQQLQQLRNVLLDPNATPAQRKQAESSLRAIGGKADAANRYTVVPGGQEISPQGLAYTRPAQVLDNQTGQFIQQGAGAPQTGPAQPTSKAEYDALPKGAQYIKDGKVLIKG